MFKLLSSSRSVPTLLTIIQLTIHRFVAHAHQSVHKAHLYPKALARSLIVSLCAVAVAYLLLQVSSEELICHDKSQLDACMQKLPQLMSNDRGIPNTKQEVDASCRYAHIINRPHPSLLFTWMSR
jgi:hypothetical protein